MGSRERSQEPEGRGQEKEARRQEPEGKGQEPEARSQEPEARSPETGASARATAAKRLDAESIRLGFQLSERLIPSSFLLTPGSWLLSPGSLRSYALLEPMVVFVLIMAYIWELRYRHPLVFPAIIGLILLSHAVRGERAEKLGFRSANLGSCVRDYAPVLAFCCLALMGMGMALQTTRPIPLDQCVGAWLAYIPWALFQQYLLNGYFLNRFSGKLSQRAAPAVTALLFAFAHTPNWFLMAITLLAGYYSGRIYLRYRNLYFLGIAHATLGFLLFLEVPDSISHHLIVGPGWFRG